MLKLVSRIFIFLTISGTTAFASGSHCLKIGPVTGTDTLIKPACFLALSDVHLFKERLQAASGDDTGYDLWDSAQQKIKELIHTQEPQFIIVLGDLPLHLKAGSDNAPAVQNYIAAFRDLKAIAAATHTPLLIVPGNNDAYTGDYCPFDFDQYPGELSLFEPVDKGVFADSLHRQLGYYSVYPLGKAAKLKVLALNSVTLSQAGKTRTYCPRYDPSAAPKELDWIEEQLAQSARNGEQVLIAMHVPPGVDGFKTASGDSTVYLWPGSMESRFYGIVSAYQKNIIGLLGGHTHMDGLRLFRNKKQDSISAVLIAVPGITPGHGNNPGMKIISFNPQQDFRIMNFTTYYMDYWDALKRGTLKSWSSTFSFNAVFHKRSQLSILQYFQSRPKSVHHIVKKMDRIYMVKARGTAVKSAEIATGIYIDYRQ